MRIKLLDQLAAKGDIFTVDQAKAVSEMDGDVLHVVLSRLERRGWIERIERGKYLILPLGASKGEYTINELVLGSSLVTPHAVAYWSALDYHGLTEQISNTVFVQTHARKKKRELEIFGVIYRIVRIKEERFYGLENVWIDETEVNVTTVEKTLVDCLSQPRYCGGVIEVAKALRSAQFDPDTLADYAQRFGNKAVIKRLGYLCDMFGRDIDLSYRDNRNYTYLDPTMPKVGKTNKKWRLKINVRLGDLE